MRDILNNKCRYMAIVSDLDIYHQRNYMSYLESRYVPYWEQRINGNELELVIRKETIEQLFDIRINAQLPNIQGSILYTLPQLSAIAYAYKLEERKTYIDLRGAYSMVLYNNYKRDKLFLFSINMYNSQQLHKEFVESLNHYLSIQFNRPVQVENYSIETPMYSDICYEELMDYLHYDSVKPNIKIKFEIGNHGYKGEIDSNQYDARFTESSYNIRINGMIIR